MTLDDRRVADLLTRGIGRDVTVVGFPYDEGVARNGGRIGARDGPAAFLKLLVDRRTGTAINPEKAIDLRHACSIPFVVGGGNDQSYPNASALLAHLSSRNATPPSLAVINIDAHLDVRLPTADGKAHSGTPFRQLLLDPRFVRHSRAAPGVPALPRFIEFAAQGSQCAQSHVDFVVQNGGDVVWLDDVQLRRSTRASFLDAIARLDGDRLFVSFDLDSVNSADAPGVSCPSPIGLSAQDALDICFESGKNPKVALFDLSELNPQIEEYRTARLTAM
ncbi:hypothetical protein HK100_007947, partial [Physocladia obscura]